MFDVAGITRAVANARCITIPYPHAVDTQDYEWSRLNVIPEACSVPLGRTAISLLPSFSFHIVFRNSCMLAKL